MKIVDEKPFIVLHQTHKRPAKPSEDPHKPQNAYANPPNPTKAPPAPPRASPCLECGSLRPKRNLGVADRSHPSPFTQLNGKAAAKVVFAPSPSPAGAGSAPRAASQRDVLLSPGTTHPSIPDFLVLMTYRNMSKVWNRLFLP